MSDFFKKAAGLIFNLEEEDATKKQHLQADETGKEIPVNASSAPAPMLTSIHADSALTEKFSAYFRTLQEHANLPAPGFHEFNNMTEAMGSVISDEVKYPAVFAGFAGTLTKDKLLDSGQQYLSVIQHDETEFEHSFQAAIKTKVEDRKTQIESKAENIRKMQEQIAALNSEIAELNRLAQEEEIRLRSEKIAYRQQSETLQATIGTAMEKIKQYIK